MDTAPAVQLLGKLESHLIRIRPARDDEQAIQCEFLGNGQVHNGLAKLRRQFVVHDFQDRQRKFNGFDVRALAQDGLCKTPQLFR